VPVVTTFTGSDVGYSRWQRAVSWCVARVTTPVFVTSLGAGRVGLRGADVVAAGVDVEHFAPVDRGEARVKLGLDPRIRTVLLPASRSRPVKRADLFDLVIERVRAAGVEVQAMSLENLDRASVAVHMNAADVVLLTSDSEGSPVVVKEALACGTPVVSVPVGDVADVVGGLPGCAVAPRDPDLLAEAIRAALTIQEEDRIRLRARGELYGRRRAAERMLEIFERVAGQ
jgi:glycosyltransferase involved in cell wall biosynthesis